MVKQRHLFVVDFSSEQLMLTSKICKRCIQRQKAPILVPELMNITSSSPVELVCINNQIIDRSKGGYEIVLVIKDNFQR